MPALIFPLVDVIAAVLAWLAAGRCAEAPRLARFWRIIAVASLVQGAADLAQALYDTSANPPYPSVADVLYLSFYPLLLVAILQLPVSGGTRPQRLRTILDVAATALGMGAVVWYVLLGPAVTDSTGSTLEVVVSVAYPVGDLVILTALAAVGLMRAPRIVRPSLAAIAVGMVAFVVADLVYGTANLENSYQSGDPVDLLYLAAIVAFGVGALLQPRVQPGDPNATAPPAAPLAERPSPFPFVALALGFGLLLGETWHAPFFPDVSLVLFAIGLTTIVTVRQYLAQRETGQLQRRMHTIVESVGEGIVTFTASGRILSANRAAEQMFGAAPGELEGQPVTMLVADPERDTAWDGSQIDRRRTIAGRRRDGATFPLELLVTKARVDGEPVYIGVGQDVGERERAQQALRESEERFRAIFDSASVGIALIDVATPGHRVTDVNAAFAAMFGQTVDDLLATRFAAIRPPGRTVLEDDGLIAWLVAGTAPSYRMERSFLHRDGSTVLAEMNVSALRDPAGRAVYAVAIVEDVTERRRMEQHKDEFISVVGHELRTPLTSIRGSLGLLAAGVVGELPEEAGEMVRVAVTNTDRLVRLINDMLALERMDAGRAEMVMEPVPVEDAVGQSIQALQAAADAAGVLLRADVEAGLMASADCDRIVQALVNLIGNAVKFSHPGGTVEITAAHADAQAVVSVRDHGRGIPAGSLEAIFDRFAQVDASDARDKGGSGLGLPIAKGIVEHHGGRLWVESAPGAGATFRFTLPLAEAEARQQREPDPA